MAILLQAAREWAEQQGPPEDLRTAARERLLRADVPAIGYGRMDEFPEDVLIALLTDVDLAELSQKGVASGWNAALSEVQRLLRDPLLSPQEAEELQRPFARVFRVAELSGHPLLRDGVRSVLPMVLSETRRASALQAQQVVAAALAYEPDEADRTEWERALRKHPEVAGFAFRTLLTLGGQPRRISNYFEEIVQRQFQDGWGLDTWFLAEYVVSACGAEPIVDALARIAQRNRKLWERIKTESEGNPCWSEETANQVEQRIARRRASRASQQLAHRRTFDPTTYIETNQIVRIVTLAGGTEETAHRRLSGASLLSFNVSDLQQVLTIPDQWDLGSLSLNYWHQSPDRRLVQTTLSLIRKPEVRNPPIHHIKGNDVWLIRNQ